MKLFHSIRTRLTVWYAAILGGTLVGWAVAAYFITRSTLVDNLDRSLRNEVKWVNEFIEPKAKKVRLKRAAILELQELRKTAPAQADEAAPQSDITPEEKAEIDDIWLQLYRHTLLSPRRQFIQILDRNGDLLYRSASLGTHQIQFSDIPYGWINVVTTKDDAGKDFRLAVMQNNYVKMFVGYPLEPLNEVLDSVFANFSIIALAALIVSLTGGWFLANASLKPVDDLTRAAREITAQNLSQRLPSHAVDDEIGRLTAQFNDMIGRLQASFAQIQRFSADASHELRTPLTVMRGEIEVALRNTKLPSSSRELLRSIHDELVRLSSIVESLMTLVRSDAGRLVFNFEEMSLDELVRDVAHDATILAEPKRIRVTVGDVVAARINGDRARLRQLLLNLVENAIKYTAKQGRIAFSLARSNGQAVVSVRDTGVGIPRKEQSRIFDRFYRVRANTGKDPQGSGLGLSIAKWIAEAHHGSIEVRSKEGKGSTFTVTLPVLDRPV